MVYRSHLTPIAASLSRSYVIPALFFNPILFLHSVNTILSRILHPIIVHDLAVQPPPYTTRGPSAQHPHLDIHSSERLCWSYTLVMVGVQLIAFSRVQTRRERWKERMEGKKEGTKLRASRKTGWDTDGVVDGVPSTFHDVASTNARELNISSTRCTNGSSREEESALDEPVDSDDNSEESEESEVIL